MGIGFRAVALLDSCCRRHDGTTHFTGETGMSCPFDMYGATQIGVFLETACQASVYSSCLRTIPTEEADGCLGSTACRSV
jgi:hypothetical protein